MKDRDKKNVKCRHVGTMQNVYRKTFIASYIMPWRVETFSHRHIAYPIFKINQTC